MRIYLDTNALIAALEGEDTVAELVRRLLESAAAGRTSFVTSELTLAELLVEPLRAGDVGRIEAILGVFGSAAAFVVVPVDRTMLLGAADLRAAQSGLKLPDAIHLATALAHDCPFVLSNDRKLPALPDIAYIRLEAAQLQLVLEEATRAD